MTKSKLTFDFNRAVENTRLDYPEESKNITFINLSAPGAQGLLTQWLESTSPEYKTFVSGGAATMSEVAQAWMEYIPGLSSFDTVSQKRFLGTMANFSSRALSASFAFNHELGHIVAPNGLPQILDMQEWRGIEQRSTRETIADSFAVLRGFNQGTMSKEDAQNLTQVRRFQKPYNTAAAITALIENPDNIDFRSLTPQNIKTFAAVHAKKYTPR